MSASASCLAAAAAASAPSAADGVETEARALAGSGGDRMVKLRLAEALTGKRLLFVPAGGGMDVRTTDMNTLLQTYGIQSLGKTSAE